MNLIYKYGEKCEAVQMWRTPNRRWCVIYPMTTGWRACLQAIPRERMNFSLWKHMKKLCWNAKNMLGTIDLQKSQILETLRSWALKYGKSKFWLPHCLMYGFDRPIAGNPGGLLTRSRHGGRSTFSWHLSSEWYRWAFDTSCKTIQYLLVDVGGCWWCNMFSLLCIYPLVN